MASSPFLAELKLFSYDFAPSGWASCNGQLMPINQNQALFALLGTTYGGNGTTTFALPDLRGRVPMHFVPPPGSPSLGESFGEEAHTISIAELPAHNHFVMASASVADTPSPANSVLAQANNAYAPAASLTALRPESVTNVGGSQAHENRHPYLVLNWCIAIQGIFPSNN